MVYIIQFVKMEYIHSEKLGRTPLKSQLNDYYTYIDAKNTEMLVNKIRFLLGFSDSDVLRRQDNICVKAPINSDKTRSSYGCIYRISCIGKIIAKRKLVIVDGENVDLKEFGIIPLGKVIRC